MTSLSHKITWTLRPMYDILIMTKCKCFVAVGCTISNGRWARMDQRIPHTMYHHLQKRSYKCHEKARWSRSVTKQSLLALSCCHASNGAKGILDLVTIFKVKPWNIIISSYGACPTTPLHQHENPHITNWSLQNMKGVSTPVYDKQSTIYPSVVGLKCSLLGLLHSLVFHRENESIYMIQPCHMALMHILVQITLSAWSILAFPRCSQCW